MLPSELLARKQFFFQCGEESTTKRDVELLGDDCLLWASDFPHEATRTNLHDLVKEFFDRKDLPAAGEEQNRPRQPKAFLRVVDWTRRGRQAKASRCVY